MTQTTCRSCQGDGIERCDNPDHGFIDALSFHDVGRLGCPCCGNDEYRRMKSWNHETKKYDWNVCHDCNGTGEQNAAA